MTTEPPPTCRLCGKESDEHKELEAQRILNHQFSNDGQVIPVDRSPKAPEKKPREVMVVPGADLLVRKLLIEKGVLSESDFGDAGAFGTKPGGNPADRPEKGSE